MVKSDEDWQKDFIVETFDKEISVEILGMILGKHRTRYSIPCESLALLAMHYS